MAEDARTGPAAEVDIAANLADLHGRIEAACREAGRQADAVTLVAVSKAHPQEAARRALLAGQRIFGENRVQEAAAKWPGLRDEFPDATLHLIGHLQTNKLRDAVALFDVIETVDRAKLARLLAREMDATGRRVDCFIEVNTGEEPQKGGVLPGEADDFIRLCRDQLALPVVGLMCIPPLDEAPVLHFALLAEIAGRNGLGRLSMGMSADFETAIRLGATDVRIGTAIFGARPPWRDG
jgi:PLP dependent protein